MSWELLKKLGWLETDVSVESLYSNWLLGYSSLLGPIAGIMIVDYFLMKKQAYDLIALYQDNAGYPAWNTAGFIAFLIPVALTLIAVTTNALDLVLRLRLVHGLYPGRPYLLLRREKREEFIMTVLIKGGTVVNADRTFVPTYCARTETSRRSAKARGTERRDSRRCRRPVRDAGRHRPAHAHAAAVHGHGGHRGLLHGHGCRPCRRHDDDHRLRHPESAAES